VISYLLGSLEFALAAFGAVCLVAACGMAHDLIKYGQWK
jgi:hypothetical protein